MFFEFHVGIGRQYYEIALSFRIDRDLLCALRIVFLPCNFVNILFQLHVHSSFEPITDRSQIKLVAI